MVAWANHKVCSDMRVNSQPTGNIGTSAESWRLRIGTSLAVRFAGTSWMVAGVLFLAAGPALGADPLAESIQIQESINQKGVKSQKKIDKVSDETQQLLSEYKLVLRKTDSLRIYNEHLQRMVDSQNREIASLNRQLGEIEETNRGVVPLMARMVDTLEQFIRLDVPFLEEERTRRIEELRAMMDRADVTVSEKYRRVMEAYQIETDYGRTIEAYRAGLDLGSGARTVDFLRIGRIALIYQTLDGKEAGVWDNDSRSWKPLSSDEYRNAITQGLRIARKQAAPDLLKLPVKAPEVAK